MSLDIVNIRDRIVSHALEQGVFDHVNQHEPKSAPGNQLWAAIWLDYVGPAKRVSGLNSTVALLRFMIRVGTSMLQDPQDAIDGQVLKAVDLLFTAYSGDFELGGYVRNVDLLGEQGTPLQAQAGHVVIDQKPYRAMDITLPLVVNDVWTQAP